VTRAAPRAVCYVRVSTVEQAQGYSLETQEVATVQLARALGAESIEVLRDTYTGTELDRPAMNALREKVRRRQCDLVVMLDVDRFARDLTDQLIVMREIDRADVALQFVNLDWENTPNGRLLLQMRGAIAEFEHAQILERTRRGKTAKAASGKLRAYAKPYGYTFDKETDTLRVFEPEAQWVRRIFDWSADEGLSTYRIARRLAELGIPGPKGPTWDHTQIWRMLNSRTYVGRLMRKDERPEWAPILVPPIVGEAVWERAQRTLAASKRFSARRTKGEYLLQRLVRCGQCGGLLTVAATGPKERRWAYYVCRRRYRTKFGPGVVPCTTPPVRTGALDVLVWERVERIVADPDGYVAGIRDASAEDRSPLQLRMKEAEYRLAQATKAIDRIHRAYARGSMDEMEHGRYLVELRSDAAAAEHDIEVLGRALQDTSRLEAMAANLRAVASIVMENGPDMPFIARQKVVRLMIDKVVVSNTGVVQIFGADTFTDAPADGSPLPFRSEVATIEQRAMKKLRRGWESPPAAPGGPPQP
jgi:site-specific DNA recombinase